MTDIQVRPARLEDTVPISLLARAGISAWQKTDSTHTVRDVPYETLTIYERWLHGGPWMSLETATLHLNHLLRGGGLPYVAEADGLIVGYAETYPGSEPAPLGDHLHLSQLLISPENAEPIADALLMGIRAAAKALKLPQLTAACASGDSASAALYARHKLNLITSVQRMSLPARAGQGFYKVTEHPEANAAQIKGWQMPLGRIGSARERWELLWPMTLQAVPEIAQRHVHRLQISASGQEAFIYCEERLYDPRQAELSLWAPRGLTGQILTALRDWCHKQGYRTLVMTVSDEVVAVLGNEAEPDGFRMEIYACPT